MSLSDNNNDSDSDNDNDNDNDDDFNHVDLFNEPEGYFQPEKPATVATHTLLSGQTLTLRLVGHNPLWGHLLWNAGRTISHYLEEQQDRIHGKDVLELGAGAGLPSLTCAIHAARMVVVTDYPDPDLIENLRINIKSCDLLPATTYPNICAEGFLWGANPDTLLAHLQTPSEGFDILILADLLFNHSEHKKMLLSVQQTLKKSSEARALVFFTPYRPWLLQNDLAFFDLAREGGFVVEKVLEKTMDKVMFEEDPGDELLRRTVLGYELSWESSALAAKS